jgi:hypothetical protein
LIKSVLCAPPETLSATSSGKLRENSCRLPLHFARTRNCRNRLPQMIRGRFPGRSWRGRPLPADRGRRSRPGESPASIHVRGLVARVHSARVRAELNRISIGAGPFHICVEPNSYSGLGERRLPPSGDRFGRKSSCLLLYPRFHFRRRLCCGHCSVGRRGANRDPVGHLDRPFVGL